MFYNVLTEKKNNRILANVMFLILMNQIEYLNMTFSELNQ